MVWFAFISCVCAFFFLCKMSFLIDDILKDKKEDEPFKSETSNKIIYSQNNFSILECSLTNRLYYNSFPSQDDLIKYNINTFSSPIYKHYTDYHVNDLRYPYTEKYYNRYNYIPYSTVCFDNQMLNKTRKGGQIRFTSNQTEELEKHFNSQKYLSPEDRKQLAALLCLSDRQVKTWFQNRRAKWRKINRVNEDIAKGEHISNNHILKYDYLY